MADTSRTLAALQTLLADNTSGAITAQVARDFLVSLNCLTGPEIAVTGAVTATVGQMHLCTGTSANYTVTLPAASGNTGRLIGFRMGTPAALTKLVTLDGNASETIDGTTTRIMWANEDAILQCDGSNWSKIAGKSSAMNCILRLNTNQTGIVNVTVTQVNVDTVEIDNSGLMANTANNRIVVQRPSNYLIVGGVIWAALSANAPRARTEIYLNGASLWGGEVSGLSGGYPTGLALVPNYLLAAGDLVTLRGLHDSGSNQTAYGLSSGDASRLSVIEQPSW